MSSNLTLVPLSRFISESWEGGGGVDSVSVLLLVHVNTSNWS